MKAESVRAGGARLSGVPRFVVYLALQAAVFLTPFPWLALPALAILGFGRAEGLGWLRWAGRSRILLMAATLPALVGLPLGEASGSVAAFLAAWEPSLLRSARLALVLASASWLSSGMSPVDLRDALSALLRPLGDRRGGAIARSASLTMAFIPWTRSELKKADEAARLRGSDPARRPARHLAALSVPLVSRSLEKARRSSEALSLRDPGFGP